jgi:methyl-accepting chemotaxis protein
MLHLSDIRIGTKLAIISGIGVVLVIGIVASQLSANYSMGETAEEANDGLLKARDLEVIKAEERAMQIAVTNVRFADGAGQLDQALKLLESKQQTVHKTIGAVDSAFHNPDRRIQIRKIGSLIDAYAATGKSIVELKLKGMREDDPLVALAATDQIQKKLENSIHTIASIETGIEQIDAAVSSDATRAFANVSNKITSANRIALAMGFLAALVMVASVLVGQLSVARPIRALVGFLRRMAQGETVEIAGIERRDEIGETARAVNEIRVMLSEKARIETEERLAQDQRTAAERDAATHKMTAEFEAAVGGIVNAAIAGDFSQRVDLSGKSGLVLRVGTSINLLCENIARALDDLIAMLNALAEGNLTQRIKADYQGSFGVLKDNANKTADQISATVSDIKAAAREVTSGSIEISSSTTDLSQRTEEQAASLEQTSASMEEIASTVKKNAEYAQAANESASATRDVADRGGQVVAQAVEAMAGIEESSRKISDIIGVIDEIARQTNLLALNAAVEAARAGEAGRGFAVVASEVRSLAQRSSQAAKDIKDLITNSNDQVKGGVDLVNRAGTALTEIVDSIKKVADIVADIANASNEQSTGIEQVNKALTQMDEVTQQNSALVEENAATAKTLEHQAKAMDERVAFFRIAGAATVADAA